MVNGKVDPTVELDHKRALKKGSRTLAERTLFIEGRMPCNSGYVFREAVGKEMACSPLWRLSRSTQVSPIILRLQVDEAQP
jgi:hypothetical protein